MKIQLSASAVILATLATSAHADADHDYPKAATAGFSTVKHNANTSTSGSRAPGGLASPGGKTREQAQLDASQPQRDDIVPPGNAN